MSLVVDRMCDGCKQIIPQHDDEWLKLTPPGWSGEDARFDFCDLNCLKKWTKTARSLP